jgi:tRNA(Ile)-lysidine synthase
VLHAVDAALEHCAAQFDRAGRLYVGFSGGLDSTVLLHALVHARAKHWRGRTVALHANHGLHASAQDWQRHCDACCRGLDVPLRSSELAIEVLGAGTEAAARTARYAWFDQHLEHGDLLLLAHHQDDQAETLLLRLLRGAGPEGLAGMPAQRDIGAGRLLRPLLSLPRQVLEDYARLHALEWVEDPSNASSDYDRNFLRREVLPLLEKRWPGYRRTFSRAATQLTAMAEQQPVAALQVCTSVVGDPGFLLAELPADTQEAALAVRGWLRGQGLRMPSAAMLTEFLRQLREGQGAKLATGDWVLRRYRDAVYCGVPGLAGPPLPVSVVPGSWLPWAGLGQVRVRCRPGTDPGELLLRARCGGERLENAAGHHHDLKNVFQSCAVPPWWRPRTPLLLRRQAGTEELLAVGAFGRSPAAVKAGIELDWKAPVLPARGKPPG